MIFFKTRFFKLILSFIIICCTVKACVFWTDDPLNFRAPTDEKLITIYRDHQATFEQLRQMTIEDLGKATYITEAKVEGKISEVRKQEYKRFLSEIYSGLQVGGAGYDKSVRFIFASGGIAISPGWVKGIEYLPGVSKKEGTVIENLDDARNLPPNVYLHQIEPNWFIFYQRTDD